MKINVEIETDAFYETGARDQLPDFICAINQFIVIITVPCRKE